MLRVNRGTVKSLAGSRGRCVCVGGGDQWVGDEEKVTLRRRKSQKLEAPETQGLRGLGVCSASPDGSKVTH